MQQSNDAAVATHTGERFLLAFFSESVGLIPVAELAIGSQCVRERTY